MYCFYFIRLSKLYSGIAHICPVITVQEYVPNFKICFFFHFTNQGRLLNFFVNLPGTSLPFPICFHSDVSGYAIAWLGIVPPTLALGTALIYVKL